MDINHLTIGEAKDLAAMFSGSTGIKRKSIYDEFVGKFVICRSRNEGVNAGRVLKIDDTGVVLESSRRLYYHKPLNKNLSWYEGVALSGLSSDSKVSAIVTKVIAEDYSLTICTDAAETSILEAKTNEQS